MTLSPLDALALIAIGLGLGLALALVAVLVYSLVSTARSLRTATSAAIQRCSKSVAANQHALDRLRSDVILALSRFDPEQLRASSLAIQRAARSLSQQVSHLHQVVFRQPEGPAINLADQQQWSESQQWPPQPQQPYPSLDPDYDQEEAARMSPDRWRGAETEQPSPLANLTEDEQAAHVQSFFAQRRASRQASAAAAIYSPGTPPVAVGREGGAYQALEEEARQRLESSPPLATPPPPDFSAERQEEEVDLSSKGELE